MAGGIDAKIWDDGVSAPRQLGDWAPETLVRRANVVADRFASESSLAILLGLSGRISFRKKRRTPPQVGTVFGTNNFECMFVLLDLKTLGHHLCMYGVGLAPKSQLILPTVWLGHLRMRNLPKLGNDLSHNVVGPRRSGSLVYPPVASGCADSCFAQF